MTITDERVLAVAREIFLRVGASATVEDIGRAVGLSGPALFKRFGSKEALLFGALRPSAPAEWLSEVQRTPDDRPIREQVIELSEELLAWLDQLVPGMAILRSAGYDPKEVLARYELPAPRAILLALGAWLQRATEQGKLSVEQPVVGAMIWFGALQVRAFMTHLAPEREPVVDSRTYAVAVTEQLLQGWRTS